MKKIFLGITMASLILCLAGCGSNNANNAANEAGNAVQDAANGAGNAAKDVAEGAGNAVKDAANGAGNAVKGFGGAINYAWSDVADEFGKVEDDINPDSASKDDIRGLVSTISDNYDKVKNGVYDNNKDAAKKMYEAGNKLETIGKGFCGIGKVSLWIVIFVWAIAVTAAKIFFVLFLTLARMVLILISAVEP